MGILFIYKIPCISRSDFFLHFCQLLFRAVIFCISLDLFFVHFLFLFSLGNRNNEKYKKVLIVFVQVQKAVFKKNFVHYYPKQFPTEVFCIALRQKMKYYQTGISQWIIPWSSNKLVRQYFEMEMLLHLKFFKNVLAMRLFDFLSVSLMAVTWNVTCTYSQFLAQKTPSCCVSLSSFYNSTIVNCPTCTCGCQNNITQPGSCVQ